MQAVATHTANLHHYAVSQMSEFHLLSLASPESGILAFTIPNLHPHDLAEALGKQDICIRAGHHCAAPLHETLGIPASTRISFGLYTNEADIDRFIAATRQIITEYA
jgi:cysteine desulfurase/selenocysteine lyase